MKKSITVASLVMGVGGLVVLIFSFLSFYTFNDDGRSAWSGDLLFPQTLIPVILAVATLVFVILDLVGVKLPEKVLTFTWPQIYATWGISAAGIMLGWLFTDPLDASLDKGAGMILMLLGSLAMAAGSVMGLLGKGTNTLNIPSGSSTPTGTGVPPVGGYPPAAPGYPPSAPPPPPPGAGTPPPPPPPA